MSYQVIARKWRPQTFAEVVGQQHVTRTLGNAIQTNRVAHAYIFSGARGVGKTTTARILAKALNCAKGPAAEPCNECDSCREIAAGTSLDVIEIDAASNRGIDQIRELREMVRYAPAASRYKVVILDEAHMLTSEASNALLKTLEEPPDRVVFVMATTEPDELEPTIRSRSQHFHFRALSFAEISGALAGIAGKESLTVEPGAIAVMARAAEGSLRDALSLLEQARAYGGDAITDAEVREILGVVPQEELDELTAAIEAQSAERVLELVHKLLADGQNLASFCREAIGHFRNLLVARVCGADSELIAAPPDERPRVAKAAANFSEEDLTRHFQILLDTHADLRRQPDQHLHLEMGLLRMINAGRLAPLEELLAELGGEASTRPARSATNADAAPSPNIGTETDRRAGIVSARPPISVRERAAAAEPAAPPANAREGKTAPASPGSSASASAPESSAADGSVARTPAGPVAQMAQIGSGLEAAQVDAIKAAAFSQQKFLGELIEHASRWERDGAEVRLFFPTESRALAEMLQSREPMEKLRNITQSVFGQGVRVCVKLEVAPVMATEVRAAAASRELRARFEQDPIVRAMLERFGGQISDVKRHGED
ncbi:MAG TPA: DNA polymerase III subunit gamma/tau [Methylomirabilota bacterium]|nr:DNA polymerase III subunit gamma/tau [Methylomirabilota bacterium]